MCCTVLFAGQFVKKRWQRALCCGTRMDKGQLLAMCKASREETLLVSHEHKGKTIRMRLSSKTSKRLLQVELSSYLEEEDTLSERQHQVTVVLLKKREKLLAQHKLRLDDEEKLSDQFVKKREQIGSKHKLSLKRHEAICESFRKRKRAADERTWSAAARRDAFIAVQGAVRADKRRRMDLRRGKEQDDRGSTRIATPHRHGVQLRQTPPHGLRRGKEQDDRGSTPRRLRQTPPQRVRRGSTRPRRGDRHRRDGLCLQLCGTRQ
eukprot:TRINITY_DN1069_c0_g1_i17.p1 TRINITY_DN1069_c0_g1~~TRINITY_DN1069_c0_g1_i17.p1  ORF type:complete len:264 (+),score=5.61 TRINITY_DN1069_c0_g1_i17:139-930(+)